MRKRREIANARKRGFPPKKQIKTMMDARAESKQTNHFSRTLGTSQCSRRSACRRHFRNAHRFKCTWDSPGEKCDLLFEQSLCKVLDKQQKKQSDKSLPAFATRCHMGLFRADRADFRSVWFGRGFWWVFLVVNQEISNCVPIKSILGSWDVGILGSNKNSKCNLRFET